MTEVVAEAAANTGDPALKAAWQLLAGIPDPEIPVISIVELGIVRGVRRDGDSLQLAVK